MNRIVSLSLTALCLSIASLTVQAAEPRKPETLNSKRCEPVAGSHIAPKADADGRCDTSSSQSVRSYSQEDIERTGRSDVGEALRALDPSLVTRGSSQPGGR